LAEWVKAKNFVLKDKKGGFGMLFFSLFVFSYSPYFQNDIGAYSLGMGGAPVGLSSSVECGLYNPAAFASTEKIKFFTGSKLTRGEISSVFFQDDSARADYVFLDYIGFALPFGKTLFFSLSLSVPYRSIIKYPMTLTVIDPSVPEGYREISGEIVWSERLYFLNPTMTKKINDRVSVGVNPGVFWKRSSMSDVYSDTAIGSVTNTVDKFGIEPCLGLQYKASDLLSFGFFIKKGFGEAYKENNSVTVSSIESDESLPLVLGLGTGINLKDKIYLNVAVEYIHWTLAYSDRDWGPDPDDDRNIIRLHLGGQYRLNDLLSLSAGFYTEPSPIKGIASSTIDASGYDQMFLTGGLGLDFGRVALNLSVASSALIKKDPALREENHFNLSVSYR
jgi:hypothetical protein